MISMRWGFQGPNYAVASACASAGHSFIDAANLIRLGKADAIICGGTEAAITEVSIAGFNSAQALSTRNDDPTTASRPFDKNRDGFVMGEGAGIFVLESESHARKRGATILAEFAGYGMTGDAYHITSPMPDGSGAARAIREALRDANLTPDDIDYINAHGTSTAMNDRIETLSIKAAFGEDAARKVSISSTKSMTGHLLGGSAGIESIAAVMAIRTGIIPPTINRTEADPDCDLDTTPNVARKRDVRAALKTTLGFGGHNAALIFKRWEG
jgi:3-oxoacyl-[acyl-carrier-protein] synthase II